jgi:hypothetical protein
MKRVITEMPDGTVAVSTHNPNSPVTIEEFAKKVSKGAAYEIVDESAIPSDRYFRDAWKVKTGGVEVDMPRARDIHMKNIRTERNKKLEALDVETLKGNDVQAEKQILRDLPTTVDLSSASTAEELKALWPSELT